MFTATTSKCIVGNCPRVTLILSDTEWKALAICPDHFDDVTEALIEQLKSSDFDRQQEPWIPDPSREILTEETGWMRI